MDAINKAFEILDVLFNTPAPLTISEIAKLAGVSTSTSHRIAAILVERGYIQQDRKRGKYTLSPQKLVFLARIIRTRLKVRTVALEFLRGLSEAVDEAVLMSLRRGQIVFNVEVVNAERFLNVSSDSTTFCLYSTGVGKIFLAHMSTKNLDEYLSSVVLKPRTPNTITDIDDLKRHLNKIRKEGVAYDDEEHELGLRMIAAPVFDWDDNNVAAIGVVGPSARISRQRMVELAPEVKKYAFQISQAMGFAQNNRGTAVEAV